MTRGEEVAGLVGQSNGDCLEFLGATCPRGYGRLTYQGKPWTAHPLSFELHIGPVGESHVCHSCDNPSCFNPEHLMLGTQQENIQDMVRKGRRKGEKCTVSVLDTQQVMTIFGLSVGNVSMISRGRSWTHLPLNNPSFVTESETLAKKYCKEKR